MVYISVESNLFLELTHLPGVTYSGWGLPLALKLVPATSGSWGLGKPYGVGVHTLA